MSQAFDTCSLCPRLCRSACPVAVGTSREAAVPAVIAEVARAWERGDVDADLAREAVTLCVDCGACEAFCHLGVPLPEALAAARARLLPAPAVAPLSALSSGAAHVAVESDERAWAGALAAKIGAPVVSLRTRDALGLQLIGRGPWAERSAALRLLLAGRTVWVADGEVARTLRAAGVAFQWLQDGLGGPALRSSCAAGAATCCGGAWPLVAHHPADAARMAEAWGAGGCADAVCGRHLRANGVPAEDSLGLLLAGGDRG